MNNLIAFMNMFFSYLLIVIVVVALCAIVGFIGISMRKRKNRMQQTAQESEVE